MNCFAGIFQMAGTVITHRTSLLSNSPPVWSLNSCKREFISRTPANLGQTPNYTHGDVWDDGVHSVLKGKVALAGARGRLTLSACSLKKASAYAKMSRAFTRFPLAAWRSVSVDKFWRQNNHNALMKEEEGVWIKRPGFPLSSSSVSSLCASVCSVCVCVRLLQWCVASSWISPGRATAWTRWGPGHGRSLVLRSQNCGTFCLEWAGWWWEFSDWTHQGRRPPSAWRKERAQWWKSECLKTIHDDRCLKTAKTNTNYWRQMCFISVNTELICTALHCTARLPHGVDAFWLLTEGVRVAAGCGAKVDGDDDHKGSLGLQLLVVVLLHEENTQLQAQFEELTD